MISCIVLGAGAGHRMKYHENKLFMKIGSYSILQWTMKHLLDSQKIDQFIVVTALGETERIQLEIAQLHPAVPVHYVVGGKERQDSVRAGLSQVEKDAHIVLVHDGARPLVKGDLVERIIEGVNRYGAVAPGISVVDTIKIVADTDEIQPIINASENKEILGKTCRVESTLPRHQLRAVQTPQGFRKDILERAHEYAVAHNYVGTDDVSLVEYMGEEVHLVEGDIANVKVTRPEDLIGVTHSLGVKEPMMRVGFGYDIHRFKEGRPCVLGGVHIESPIGPDGHSDADVLIHALMDALLGAAGLRDIGYYFPPEDEAFKGISSMLLLERVVELLGEHKFTPCNVDIMVIAEAPRLKQHIETMKENLSKALSIPTSRVSVKATTNEGLGTLGRVEGIAAQAVVTIYGGDL